MNKRKQRWGWVLMGILAGSGVVGLTRSATPPPATSDEVEVVLPVTRKDPIAVALEAATTAAELARFANTPADWSAVAAAWSEAIQALQAVPAESPQWLFAQRKAREYLANQIVALQRVEQAGRPTIFPTLGNDVLDEQIGLYLSYIATFGPPDIMVIGSSRALQGLDPQVLQQQLAEEGLDALKVYTFAVNGATAQVLSFILRQLLTPEQMPQMIIWAGGSRSFNSGRVDRTFAKILESPGYAALQAGDRPEFAWGNNESNIDKAASMPISDINGYGFLAVDDVFNPTTYYQQFPQVPGVYDASYRGFDLNGVQTVSFRAIAQFANSNDIPLIFVNLPLSSDYLDETRLYYEQQFQQYLASEAAAGDFVVVDLLQEWPGRDNFFADPSHLNRIGAAQVATKLANAPNIPWEVLADDNGETTSEANEAETETPENTLENEEKSPAIETEDES